jgi:hypothetical protein
MNKDICCYIIQFLPRRARLKYLICFGAQYKSIFKYFYDLVIRKVIEYRDKVIINSNLYIAQNYKFEFTHNKLLEWCNKPEIMQILQPNNKLGVLKGCQYNIMHFLQNNIELSTDDMKAIYKIVQNSNEKIKKYVFENILNSEYYYYKRYKIVTNIYQAMRGPEILHDYLTKKNCLNLNIYLNNSYVSHGLLIEKAIKYKHFEVLDILIKAPLSERYLNVLFKTGDREYINKCMASFKFIINENIIDNIHLYYWHPQIVEFIDTLCDLDYVQIINNMLNYSFSSFLRKEEPAEFKFIKYIYSKIKQPNFRKDFLGFSMRLGAEFMHFFIDKGFCNLEDGLNNAIYYKNIKAIYLMIAKGAPMPKYHELLKIKEQRILKYYIKKKLNYFYPLLINIRNIKYFTKKVKKLSQALQIHLLDLLHKKNNLKLFEIVIFHVNQK